MRIADGVKEINAEFLLPSGDYPLLDAWTTVDGQWHESDSPYSIEDWVVKKYAIPGELGGGQHLYVRVVDENGLVDMDAEVAFKNKGILETRKAEHKDGFANIPVWNVFYPDQGQNGGWETGVMKLGENGVPIPGETVYGLRGGGLPYALHVSLFAVYQRKSSGNGNGDGDGENTMVVTIPHDDTIIRVYTNGHNFNMEVLK